jgi:hypothetical protein
MIGYLGDDSGCPIVNRCDQPAKYFTYVDKIADFARQFDEGCGFDSNVEHRTALSVCESLHGDLIERILETL